MENIVKKLLSETTSVDEKHQIFLITIKHLGEIGSEPSYAALIQDILPAIGKNVKTFEEKKMFLMQEIEEYVQKYELLRNETMKYQVALAGNQKDCQIVEKILDYGKVHFLGQFYTGGGIRSAYDYIIVCSDMREEELTDFEQDKIVRYDFLRFCHYGISPETAYLDMKLRQKIESGIEGAVTGLSYQQVGLNYDKLKCNLACLAAPAQDLYLDYYNFMWLYDEVVCKRHGILKYCVIGMDFYRLWYDLSMSQKRKIRMLPFYKRLRCVHHFHDMDSNLIKADEYWKICDELMIDNYMDEDFKNSFHPEQYYIENKQKYKMTKNEYIRDIEKIKKVFDKPYPHTFRENVSILEKYLKFLFMRDIKTLIYIPPFTEIFNKFTSEEMKETTWSVLTKFQDIYGFEILDLSDHEVFTNDYFRDWSHLNSYGANLASSMLNEYMDRIWNKKMYN